MDAINIRMRSTFTARLSFVPRPCVCGAVEDGPDILTDREMRCIGNGSGGGTWRGRLGSGREEAEACCFKSKGDNKGG